MSVYIIAEAGVNHNGSLEIAKKLVDKAAEAGADCIKFQTFKAENLVSKYCAQAKYQNENTGKIQSQLQMLKELELSFNDFEEIKNYCDYRKIDFLSTPFDIPSIAFLNTLGMKFWKIPSGEINDLPYLMEIAKTGKPVVMSTGMCTLEEVETAVKILRQNGSGEISLLHCTTNYPTPYENVNLNAMITLRERFNCTVGYSDHTKGFEVSVAAVAMGAQIIEKHFTLDKNMSGPDHKASLEPDELKNTVSYIRNTEKALGCFEKKPDISELSNISAARKSIVAKRDIKRGEILTENNITAKRPGNGISPMKWFEVLGTAAVRDFKEDELIEL
ncbi:MAG: N-acetylneuraminate synthase [Oscillospiraceae bacterium]|nr:N-acetylneuraminate synthase [Oscillospiraceae bacterium]